MNKLGKILINLGIFLIILSGSLFTYNLYKEQQAITKSQETLNILKKDLSLNEEKIINIKEPIDYVKEMDTINIDGFDYLGTITIPNLGLELPIISEYQYNRLDIAPCRYYGSIYTNDLIICAHSYKNFFKNIIKLEQKDQVIFTDVSSNIYLYEVLEVEILDQKDISGMIDNEFDLTLYTCTDDGLRRIAVRCNRVYNYV